MRLINYPHPLPHFSFTKDMLKLDNIDIESDEFIIIPFKDCANENFGFMSLRETIEDRMIEFYPDEQFEMFINDDVSLLIEKHNGFYTYTVQVVAENAYMDYRVDLDLNELRIIMPIVNRHLGNTALEQVREESVKTFIGNISDEILSKLKLVADCLDGNRYYASWITTDNKSSVVVSIEDYTIVDCSVQIVKFAC